ncbi:MAG TPA: AtpZ/AtpI family protein [Thiotrichales bacterium]|nr:AtpZ/AtpI family protein [Thiotrichales bacterium]
MHYWDAMSDKTDGKMPNLLLISAGSMFTSMVVAGFLVGYWLDSLFDTQPFGLLICGVMGFIGGARKVYDILMKMPHECK